MVLSKHVRFLTLTAMGLFCFLFISFPVSAASGKRLTLNEEQKRTLAQANAWKVNIRHDYGRAQQYKGISIAKDCEHILQYAGWKALPSDAPDYALLFEISVTGIPKGCSYTSGYHYTAAEIKIEASIKVPERKWEFTFNKSSGLKGCPYFISGSYKKPEDAPFNAAYYDNKDFFVQLFNIIYLSKGIDPISMAMKDSALNGKIREHLHYFAGETGDRNFRIPLLVSVNNESGDIKKAAIVALGAIGDPDAIPSLSIALLEDKNAGVRSEAAQALGKIGDSKVADVLAKALQEDKSNKVRQKAAEALDQIGWQPQSIKARVFYYLAKNKKKDILKMGKEVLPVCIEALNSKDSAIRQESARILGELKFAEAVESLSRRLSEDTSSSVRKNAANALGAIADPGAIPSLSIALLEDKNSSVRSEAAQALGKIGDSKVADALAKALQEDKSKTVRQKAAEALDQIGWQPQSIKARVFYYLAKNKKKDILKMGKEVLPVCIEALNSKDSAIRQESARILGELKFVEATEHLSKRLSEDKVFGVRSNAVKALGKIGDPGAIPSLSIALLEDKNSSIRAGAAQALGKIGDPKVMDALAKALQQDKSKQVRKNAAEALGKIGDKQAIKILNQSLKKETDNSVKKVIGHSLMALGSDAGVPLEIRIETYKKNKAWQKLKSFLKEQKTEALIEQLKTKDNLIKKMIAEILMERTGKFDLGTDHTAWKNWFQKKSP